MKETNHINIITQIYGNLGKLIEKLSKIYEKRTDKMNMIYATYNIHHNSIDVSTYGRLLFTMTVIKQKKDLKKHSLL